MPPNENVPTKRIVLSSVSVTFTIFEGQPPMQLPLAVISREGFRVVEDKVETSRHDLPLYPVVAADLGDGKIGIWPQANRPHVLTINYDYARCDDATEEN